MISGARRLRREWRTWTPFAGVALAAAGAAMMPPPAALAGGGSLTTRAAFAALASAAIVALALLPFVLSRRTWRRAVWLSIATIALILGVGSFSVTGSAERRCTATYNGKSVAIGTEHTPLGLEYQRRNPDYSPEELLFDSLGVADKAWTRRSIDRCRATMAGTYYLWLPFLIVSLVAALEALPASRLLAAGPSGPVTPRPAAGPARYDVFISYRHGGADAEVAVELLRALEADGYTVAIDERDFPANASFLEEMERCIQESRYTVAIVSPRYLESGNCQEEAIVCKVLDMGERRRRLIPFIIAPVVLPAWLYGIVGMDSTRPDPLVEPIARLKATLGPPLGDAGTRSTV